MIKQSAIGLNSRTEANPYNEHGFLPIITSPMNSVVNSKTCNSFLKNKIQVCLPRKSEAQFLTLNELNVVFESYSLSEFNKLFIGTDQGMYNGVDSQYTVTKVCIDTANGNMQVLHDKISFAKKLYGDKLIIMAGNVSSVDAFIELAKTGVDYIRVGIGGGGGCTTTVHTGVGQENLETLIKDCKKALNKLTLESFGAGMSNPHIGGNHDKFKAHELKAVEKLKKFSRVKIVADGISSFIKQENLHRNGYAAINRLLYAGASLVMIGSIFNKALDSAGEKLIKDGNRMLKESEIDNDLQKEWYTNPVWKRDKTIYSTYRGMSTREEQKTYRKPVTSIALDTGVKRSLPNIRPSEGKTITLLVEYTIKEWVEGCDDNRHDDFPGFVNALKSAMAYTGSKTMKEFKQ